MQPLLLAEARSAWGGDGTGPALISRFLACERGSDLVPAEFWRVWQSHIRYLATRHAGRGKEPALALVHDLELECLRRGLPRPNVEVLNFCALPNGGGLAARARLRFAVAVRGPLLLGRDSHQGGGVFAVEA